MIKKFFTEETLESYSKKFSASVVYGILSSIAVNFFFQPGHVYSSGVTGLAQILTTLSEHVVGIYLPVSVTIYAINLPLLVIAWFFLGRKFTIFTTLTVTLSVLMISIIPETTLTRDPIINAIFGGMMNGCGIGFAMRNGLSSGGLDIVSLSIRKRTGHSVGSISICFNAIIVMVAGFLFGWTYALYTILTIFISGRITDAVFTQQKKVQVMIVTKNANEVTRAIQNQLHRGATLINEAEGAYTHDKQTVLITVITRFEIPQLKEIMKETDPQSFVSISENVKIMGNFNEDL